MHEINIGRWIFRYKAKWTQFMVGGGLEWSEKRWWLCLRLGPFLVDVVYGKRPPW